MRRVARWGTVALLLLAGLPVPACAQAANDPAPSAPAQPAAPSPYRITGVVLSQRLRTPVPHCHVVPQLDTQTQAAAPGRPQRRRGNNSAAGESLAADTDDQGRFALTLPSAGRWALFASAPGYRAQGLDEHEGFSTAAVLSETTPTLDVTFLLEPDSLIAGYVLDEAAEPVRDAIVTLSRATSGSSVLPNAARGHDAATTDDRGHYELSGIAPGDYRLSVQAKPWYAVAAGQQGRGQGGVDPALDVTYPTIWYPGAADDPSAGVLALHAGETRQVDFNLLPVPAAHLRLSRPASHQGQGRGFTFPSVERIEGNGSSFGNSVSQNERGEMDFGGLAPGLYRVTTPGAEGQASSFYLQVQSGASTALTSSNALEAAEVTMQIQGEGADPRTGIMLTDVRTGNIFSSFSDGGGGNLRRRGGTTVQQGVAEPATERSLQVPAGTYQVTVTTNGDQYLAGLILKGKMNASRVVTLPAGASRLILQVARGRGTVSGHVSLKGKPRSGAMVMLVPATWGEPGSSDLLARDQSNSDGSFEIPRVLPGQYILIAIDQGWGVNWHDASTLGRYLMGGTPLTIQPRMQTEQEIEAQSP